MSALLRGVVPRGSGSGKVSRGVMTATRVSATTAALELIEKLRSRYGPLLFHQSGGCCDGSSPMCFPRGEFVVGEIDVLLGEIGGQPFYMSHSQFEYWAHTHLIIDVVEGRGGMFSLEGPDGAHFLTRSRLYTAEEWAELPPLVPSLRPQSPPPTPST